MTQITNARSKKGLDMRARKLIGSVVGRMRLQINRNYDNPYNAVEII
jgi:hypothetical protein